MMRGGDIGLNMPIEMVRQVLAGTWAEYEREGWHIVTSPLFTLMEKVCQPGPAVLPLKPWRQTFVDIVYDGGHDVQLVKPGQGVIDVKDHASFLRVVVFGQGDK